MFHSQSLAWLTSSQQSKKIPYLVSIHICLLGIQIYFVSWVEFCRLLLLLLQCSSVQWGWRPYYPRLGEWSAYSNFFHKSGNSKIFLSHLLQYSNSSSPYMLVLHCSSSLQSQRFSVENPNSLMIRHSINCPLCWVSQKLKIQGDYILSSEHSAHRG